MVIAVRAGKDEGKGRGGISAGDVLGGEQTLQ